MCWRARRTSGCWLRPSRWMTTPSAARAAVGCWCSSATGSTRRATVRSTGHWRPVPRPTRPRWRIWPSPGALSAQSNPTRSSAPATRADLAFAWRTCRAVKSNAIVIAGGGATLGIGMGQVNRVDAARLAVERGGDRGRVAVAASDAFFPFPDGLETLAAAGVKAIVHPGGSVRDDEVTVAAEKAGVTLYLTGARHFAH